MITCLLHYVFAGNNVNALFHMTYMHVCHIDRAGSEILFGGTDDFEMIMLGCVVNIMAVDCMTMQERGH